MSVLFFEHQLSLLFEYLSRQQSFVWGTFILSRQWLFVWGTVPIGDAGVPADLWAFAEAVSHDITRVNFAVTVIGATVAAGLVALMLVLGFFAFLLHVYKKMQTAKKESKLAAARATFDNY